MKVEKSKIPVVLIASAVSVIALIVLQLIWMRYARQLSEEMFNQRVTMALCSAIENYDNGALCAGKKCLLTTNSGKPSLHNVSELPADLVDNPGFRAELSKFLKFYQVNLGFELSLSNRKDYKAGVYQSVVSLPARGGEEAYLRVIFPEKKTFILKRMSLMIVTSVFILAFITTVLLMVNWSLLKQKRLLQTNVNYFNNMAHDFRTPLSNIGLAANLLRKKHPEFRDNSLIEVIRFENTQLLAEIERILYLANPENGDYVLHKEATPLKEILESAIRSLLLPIKERQAQVTTDITPENLEVYGDKQHLSSVFRNLLDNALKYTTATPVIHISAQRKTNGVVVAIQDNGIGIDKRQHKVVFEKFKRLNNGNQFTQKGFGLGLSYVKSIIELHKGFVRVSSEEQKGSLFEVFLPDISSQDDRKKQDTTG